MAATTPIKFARLNPFRRWLTAVVPVAAIVASLLVVLPQTDSQQVEMTAVAGSRSIGVSVGPDVLSSPRSTVDTIFSGLKSAGVSSVRFDIPWPAVEATQGRLDWSRVDPVVDSATSRGLDIVAIVTYSPAWAAKSPGVGIHSQPRSAVEYGDFAGKVAARYGDRIDGYEIWNEPNAAPFFYTPNANFYTEMLQNAYPKIKQFAPHSTVLAGALAFVAATPQTITPVEFLRQMYAAGAQGDFDALSVHPYSYPNLFTDNAVWNSTPVRFLAELRKLMLANGDAGKTVVATEYGAPSTGNISEARQSDILVSMLRSWAPLPWAGPVFIYTDVDSNTGSADPEDNFGLMRSNLAAKPAAGAVSSLIARGVPAAEIEGLVTNNTIGAPLTPAYRINDNCAAKEFVNGSSFRSSRGAFSTPAPADQGFRTVSACPKGPFVNGQQDVDTGGSVRLFWSQATGTHFVQGGILLVYRSALGFPTSNEYASGSGRRQDFEHGYVTWTVQAGGVVVLE